MKHTNGQKKRNASRATIWGELSEVCERVHYHLYESGNETAAKRYRLRLRRIIGDLPDNDVAILKEEALALLCELTQDLARAVEHRQREIELIERLHASVRHSVEAGEYNRRMGKSILADWDRRALSERRAILRRLKTQLSPRPLPAVRRRTG